MAELPFEGGYGELGIIGPYGSPKFTRTQASTHAAAMKDYMIATERGNISSEQESRCKLAIAFFAMTIAEAARFRSAENMVYNGGIDPAGVIPLLQKWVINSSVCDDKFPLGEIAIAGIHKQRPGKVWKGVIKNLERNTALAPTDAGLAGDSLGSNQLITSSPSSVLFQ
jgi:hypothetical protein